MAETLLGRLINRTVQKTNSRQLRPIFTDLLEALDGTYLLLEIRGDDGGVWLFLIQDGQLLSRALEEAESADFKHRYLYFALPDWLMYDLLLKSKTPSEAMAYAEFGGTANSHPSWVRLKGSKLLELIQMASQTL